MDDDLLTINERPWPLPAGLAMSSTTTVDNTRVEMTTRPTGDGMAWQTFTPSSATTVDEVARYRLRLADYDLLHQAGYRCATGAGIRTGEITLRSRNVAPALEVVRPGGTRIPLFSIGGW